MTTESYATSFHSEHEVSGGTEVRFTHRRLIPLIECVETCSGAWRHCMEDGLHHFSTKFERMEGRSRHER
jgi:hypothetical protein